MLNSRLNTGANIIATVSAFQGLHGNAWGPAAATPPAPVRTRLYFTSESHVAALVRLLQHPPPGAPPLLDASARRYLADVPELVSAL